MSRHEMEAWLTAQPETVMTDPDNPEWTEEDFARTLPADRLPLEILVAFAETRAGQQNHTALKALGITQNSIVRQPE